MMNLNALSFSILLTAAVFLLLNVETAPAQNRDIRALGITPGVMEPGPLNAITDVEGVRVGHRTLIEDDHIRTGVTAVLPHPGNIFQQKVPAAVYVGNGFGKLAGSTQIEELGNIETPVILTNTLSVPVAADALIDHTFTYEANDRVHSVNPVVGETNDGRLNDIRGRHVTKKHVLEAIEKADEGPVQEGNVGAGTGTTALEFKGGIGTSSRKLPESLGGYTVGVLVQTNFGGVLKVNGAPVGKQLGKYYLNERLESQEEGSCMIVAATDAPLSSRTLRRLAKRALLGMARTGGIMSNGSGDYVIAFSTAESVRIPHESDASTRRVELLRNEAMSPLFMAVIESTEEAILNSLFHAETMTGRDGHTIEALPVEKVLRIINN